MINAFKKSIKRLKETINSPLSNAFERLNSWMTIITGGVGLFISIIAYRLTIQQAEDHSQLNKTTELVQKQDLTVRRITNLIEQQDSIITSLNNLVSEQSLQTEITNKLLNRVNEQLVVMNENQKLSISQNKLLKQSVDKSEQINFNTYELAHIQNKFALMKQVQDTISLLSESEKFYVLVKQEILGIDKELINTSDSYRRQCVVKIELAETILNTIQGNTLINNNIDVKRINNIFLTHIFKMKKFLLELNYSNNESSSSIDLPKFSLLLSNIKRQLENFEEGILPLLNQKNSVLNSFNIAFLQNRIRDKLDSLRLVRYEAEEELRSLDSIISLKSKIKLAEKK